MITRNDALSAPVTDPAQLRRIAFAAFAGTTIEFYDFFIYRTAAALPEPVAGLS